MDKMLSAQITIICDVLNHVDETLSSILVFMCISSVLLLVLLIVYMICEL